MSLRDPGASPGGATTKTITTTKEPAMTPTRDLADDKTRIRRALFAGLRSADCEQDRAVLRCALNLLNGAQGFEIDPVSGVARTVTAFERAAAGWAEQYAWYERREDADSNPYRHDLAMEGRAVQARFASVHPHLAEPLWFPDHGPQNCVFCGDATDDQAGD